MKPSPRALVVVAAALAAGLCEPLPGLAQEDAAFCPPPEPGLKCSPGNGLTSAGGGAKAPHNDGAGRKWPKIDGIFWQATDNRGRKQIGSPDNDELLGHHGNERLSGAGGNDILWGDWDPRNNSTRQSDYLSGGSGDDWIYPSHGRNIVMGGPGRDYVYAYYGHGVIDCGPGIQDTARTRTNGAYRVRNCETIRHFCAFGSDSKGNCLSPSGKPVPTSRRTG